MTAPKILVYDIETSPLVSYTWQTFKTNVIKVKQQQVRTAGWEGVKGKVSPRERGTKEACAPQRME